MASYLSYEPSNSGGCSKHNHFLELRGKMSNLSYGKLRKQLVQAAHLLYQAGVMSHSGHGNMSVRLLEADRILLTSTGQITHLKPEQLVVVTYDGEVVEGTMDPITREIVGMHACVYRARNDAHAVIHTHSPRVTSFALAHKSLPCVYEAFLRFVFFLMIRGPPRATLFPYTSLYRQW